MAFPIQTGPAFIRANIEAITAGQMGCYGLYKTGEWIYVGEGDIRQRLLDHLNGDNTCITDAGPTHYVIEVTANHKAREIVLIAELKPLCNKKLG